MISSLKSLLVTSRNQQSRAFSVVTNSKRVCIVGGGVSGLQTMDRLQGAGVDCTLFESQADVGGVWRTIKSGTQIPRELFEFPGFPCKPNEAFEKYPRPT